MVRHEIFCWNSTHLGWYVMRSFLGIEHIWDGTSWDLFLEFNTSGMVRHEIFSWNSTHLGWYVMRSFLGIQHIWDGTSWETMHFLERIQARFSSNCLDFLQIKENLANMRWMKIKVMHWSKHTWKCLNWSSFFRRQNMTRQDINMDMWSCTCISNGQRGGFAISPLIDLYQNWHESARNHTAIYERPTM